MITVASRRAKSERLDNIEFVQMDAEALRLPDVSFDIVTNAYGLMFCADPARALEESRRVLVPGGRVAIAVWDEPSKSPFFTVIRDAAQRFLALPEPAPHEPNPFRLASADLLGSMLKDAGFSSIAVNSFPMTFDCKSSDEYCQIFADFAWKARMAALSSDGMKRFKDAVADAVRPHVTGERVTLVATSLCAFGRK